MTTKLAPNVGPMVGGRHTATPVCSRSAGRWPTAKSYEKLFLFAKEQQQTYDFSKVANPSSVLHHHKHSKGNAAVCCTITSAQKTVHSTQGSGQLTSGDVGSDDEAQDRFSPKEVNPEWVRNPVIPVPEVRTPKTEVQQWQRNWKLHSELLWCQGYRTLRCLRHRTLLIVHSALNFV